VSKFGEVPLAFAGDRRDKSELDGETEAAPTWTSAFESSGPPATAESLPFVPVCRRWRLILVSMESIRVRPCAEEGVGPRGTCPESDRALPSTSMFGMEVTIRMVLCHCSKTNRRPF